jgi:peroxiredoxin
MFGVCAEMSKTSERRKRQQHKKKQVTTQQQIAILLVGLLILGVLAWVFFGTGSSNAMDFEAATLDGEVIRLSDYQGQVVMLNFWATWCPPCRAEMPAIQDAYTQHQDDGFVVLAINNRETPIQVRQFATSYGLSFPIVLDIQANIQEQFGIRSFPTSIFLNTEGEAYATHSGAVSPQQLEAYIAQGMPDAGS